MDNCTIDCIEVIGNFSQEATCSFVQDNCIQDTVQFVQAYYCLGNSSLMVLALVSVAILIYTGDRHALCLLRHQHRDRRLPGALP